MFFEEPLLKSNRLTRSSALAAYSPYTQRYLLTQRTFVFPLNFSWKKEAGLDQIAFTDVQKVFFFFFLHKKLLTHPQPDRFFSSLPRYSKPGNSTFLFFCTSFKPTPSQLK